MRGAACSLDRVTVRLGEGGNDPLDGCVLGFEVGLDLFGFLEDCDCVFVGSLGAGVGGCGLDVLTDDDDRQQHKLQEGLGDPGDDDQTVSGAECRRGADQRQQGEQVGAPHRSYNQRDLETDSGVQFAQSALAVYLSDRGGDRRRCGGFLPLEMPRHVLEQARHAVVTPSTVSSWLGLGGVLGNSALLPFSRLRNAVSSWIVLMSGAGKTTVVFLSTPISTSDCRFLNCSASGWAIITSEARASSPAARASPSAAMIFARFSRSASAWRAIARFIVSGSWMSFNSTVVTSTPHASVCTSRIERMSWLILSVSDSVSSSVCR